MKTFFVVLVFLLLAGCSTISDRRVATGCQVADGLATYYALEHGAVEANGLIAGLGPTGILLLKLGIAYWLWTHIPPIEEATAKQKTVAGAFTILGCVPAINNINVIRGLP